MHFYVHNYVINLIHFLESVVIYDIFNLNSDEENEHPLLSSQRRSYQVAT